MIARALAAAHAAQPITDGALVDLLVASLCHEPAEAEAAADALALARGVRGREARSCARSMRRRPTCGRICATLSRRWAARPGASA